VIEAEVHQQLRTYLRQQGAPHWPHHLTLARLVARALRLGRSALIQAGSASICHGRYRLSYLMSVLLWPGPVILVLPEVIQQHLMFVDLPRLRQWIPTYKSIQVGDNWPGDHFRGLLITTPEIWLADRLGPQTRFPSQIPTLIDGIDDLEGWVQQQLTVTLDASAWDALMLAYPDQQQLIRDIRVQLTHGVFQYPANPYHCHLLEAKERTLLATLYSDLVVESPQLASSQAAMPPSWRQFWQQFWTAHPLLWVSFNRSQGQFCLHGGPTSVAAVLQPIWLQQPLVLIGAAFDLETQAPSYRQRLGLPADLTCLKFSLDRHSEAIRLYVPDHLPMPNTRQFQAALLQEIRQLLAHDTRQGVTVILVSDIPLKAQLGSILASEFGSRVQVDRTCLDDNGILVTDWQFWQHYQTVLPTPHLLIIPTLPIPSLEAPLVAARVAYYKSQRQDWFRRYLLPIALSTLQRAVAPIRDTQGIVALLDNRVNYRSYGRQVLEALSPAARTTYLETEWLRDPNCSLPG